jgi:hypothetical protein
MLRLGGRVLLYYRYKGKQKITLNLITRSLKTPAYLQKLNLMRFHVNGLTCEYRYMIYAMRLGNIRFSYMKRVYFNYTILPINLKLEFTLTNPVKYKITSDKYVKLSKQIYMRLTVFKFIDWKKSFWSIVNEFVSLDLQHGISRMLIRQDQPTVSNPVFDEIEVNM